MTKEEFDILTYLELHKGKWVSRQIIKKNIGYKTSDLITRLIEEKKIYQDECLKIKITQEGCDALEPYRVKRAILIAAGLGTRLKPYTNITPKPLLKVHGVSMIETLLEAIIKAGIEEIIIVRGYLKDKFNYLLNKYPQIQFIDNDKYLEYNNIFSAYLVREKIANSYIMESDLVLLNQEIIQKYQYKSNYIGEFAELTQDWRYEVRDNKILQAVIGGEQCYRMYGVSYWNEKEGTQLARDLEHAMSQEGTKSLYWDEVAINLYPRDIELRPIKSGDIIEIDTVEEYEEINNVSIL